MESISITIWLTSFTLLLFTLEVNGQQYPIIMSPMGLDTIVNVGQNVTLSCSGNKQSQWLSLSHESTPGKMTDEIIGENHLSYLQLTNVTVREVSYYCCLYMDQSEEDILEEENCIYLFVKDKNHPLRRVYGTISGQMFHKITIPCKGSSPDVKPTLSFAVTNTILYPSTDDENGKVTYDPHEGITFEDLIKSSDGLYLNCSAEHESYLITVHIEDDSDYVTTISITGPYHVEYGKKLVLNCTEYQDVYYRWTYPNPIKEGHIIEMYNKLIIHKVTYDDSGNYTCSINNRDSHTIPVKVIGRNDFYIDIDTSEEDFIMHKNENVSIVATIRSYPKATLTWWFWPCTTFSDNKCQTANQIQDIKGKFIIKSKEFHEYEQIALMISSVNEDDSGPYMLRARNSYKTKEVNFTLNVKTKPDLIFDGIKDSYFENENTQLTCIITGYPKPKENEISWYFLPTNEVFEVMEENCSPPFENGPIDPKKYKYIETQRANNLIKLTSVLNYTVQNTGYIICHAFNELGAGCIIQRLLVTEGDPEIFTNPVELVQGDNVTLTCRIPIYNFTNNFQWLYNGNPLQLEKDIIVVENQTKFSYMSILLFPNIRKYHSGLYECEFPLINQENSFEKIPIDIDIKDEMKPIIKHTNMNDSEIIVKQGSVVNFTCVPYGLPKPKIIWYKDGAKIKPKRNLIFKNETFLTISYAIVDDEGEYTCKAFNRVGEIEKKSKLIIEDKVNIITGVVVGAIIIIGLILVSFYLGYRIWREKKLRKQLTMAGLINFEEGAVDSLNRDLPIDEQAELLPYNKEWEFPRDKLHLGKQLGAGAFGIVVKGEAIGILEEEVKTTVAVKMVKRNADTTYIKALASELKIMVHLGKHLNVVNLLGACTRNVIKMELLVIVEYCRYGNLHNYLLRHRGSFIDQLDLATLEINPNSIIPPMQELKNESSDSKNMKYAALTWSDGYEQPISTKPDAACAIDYRDIKSNSANSGQIESHPSGTSTGEIITSDMSLISMSPSGGEDNTMILSNNSTMSEQPIWRSNYRGDYKPNLSNPVCTRDLLCWAFQVARGMEYLCSRKVLHGDLAARNILLAENNIVKICDFGLAKSMYKSDNYKKKGNGPLPFKWMAIESIRDRVFSSQSDVWSYGIVLWEFFSLAKTPYPGMEADEKLYNKLLEGYRMERPEYAPKSVYSIMQECWQMRPNRRPSFDDLAQQLGEMLENSVKQHYIDLNDPYICMNAQRMGEGQNDYLAMVNAPDYDALMSPMEEHKNNLYVNSNGPGPSDGYLQMKGSDNIFSPRPLNSEIPQAFDFNPTKLRTIETDGADGNELQPILSAASPSLVNNPAYKYNNIQTNEQPTTNAENYINMPGHQNNKNPINKTIPELAKSVSNPHYMSANATFHKNNDGEKEAEAYINIPKDDDTIHI